MALIQKLAKLAHQTFAQIHNDRKLFLDNLTRLVATTNILKKTDVGLIPEYLTQNRTWEASSNEPPVSYIDIYKHDTFTLGIFIVKQGARIPLHDHPGMYGIIKVLHGNLRVKSYNRTDHESEVSFGDPIPVTKIDTMVLGEDDEPGILSPNDSNLHEIIAEGGIAAFLDVLAPPYASANDCHYYKELDSTDKSTGNLTSNTNLIEINAPDTYWSESHPYIGPSIDLSDL